MRARTLAALVLVVAALAGAGFVALSSSEGGDLRERWLSDTDSAIPANHHAVAAGRVDGEPAIFAPIGGRGGGSGCMLAALDGQGAVRWRHRVPPANCTIHAVADPAIADYDADGDREVVFGTTEQAVFARRPLSGELEFRHELTGYAYAKPTVADLTGDGDPELLVTDIRGTVFAFSDGEVLWSDRLGSISWAAPAVRDFDADGDSEVVVGVGDGRVVAYDADGERAWNRSVGGAVTWTAAGQLDADAAVEFVAATSGGDVVALDGRGAVEWRRSFESLAAVRALGDADADRAPEVYATASDGKLRALSGASGDTEWATQLTTESAMMPPPSLGDVDGDGGRELVAATNGGVVSVVGPGGRVLATYERSAAVFTHVTLADTDADGRAELYVPYGDGRVAALSYRSSSSSS